MLAVFFATSDEMLPIFLSSLTESSGISWKTIVLITLSKAALGILLGYLADLLFGRWFRAQKSIHSFCDASTATATKKRAACSSPPCATR